MLEALKETQKFANSLGMIIVRKTLNISQKQYPKRLNCRPQQLTTLMPSLANRALFMIYTAMQPRAIE